MKILAAKKIALTLAAASMALSVVSPAAQAQCNWANGSGCADKNLESCAQGNQASCDAYGAQHGIELMKPDMAAAQAAMSGHAAQQPVAAPSGEQASLILNSERFAAKKIEQQKKGTDDSNDAGSKEDSPCGMVLCMASGGLSSPSGCRKSINAFFKIRRERHGHFSPSRTANARRDRLNQCGGAEKSQKDFIVSQWGHLYSSPFSFY
ncbi:MAG: hypothetical protein LBU76_06110 [Azoarcus sp.]|jgi:hypothetical protein|nr:hypothetical protein [Azoarcus sp.]